MPPIGVFRERDRPKGWEFASCLRCNNGTRGADAVAQLFSMVEPASDNEWKTKRIQNLLSTIAKLEPDVLDEIAAELPSQPVLLKKKWVAAAII